MTREEATKVAVSVIDGVIGFLSTPGKQKGSDSVRRAVLSKLMLKRVKTVLGDAKNVTYSRLNSLLTRVCDLS